MAVHKGMDQLLGPAALGLLTRAEQAQLDRHVARCASCSAELAELQAVVTRLADLTGQDALLDDLQLQPARVDAVMTAVADERTREHRRSQRWQATLAAAASVVVLAAGLVTATALARDDAPKVPLEAVAVQAAGQVQASADLVAHTWGVEIKLTATGLQAGQPYTVEVRTTGGDRVSAGAFLGTGQRTMLCNLNASVLRADADLFRVLDAQGTQVLTAEL